jgi:transcriptional regulator with XRE-family HTH domain
VETPARVIEDVGRRVAELRRSQGATQAQLAERLGMPVQDLQNIELGKRNLTLRSLCNLARGLGVPSRSLLDPPATREPRRRGRPPRAVVVAADKKPSGRS